MHSSFSVLRGADIKELMSGREPEIVETVREAYLTHDCGDSVNPDSYFLRFPDKPDSRIIALPAYLGGSTGVAGLKWIGSFPGNVAFGDPRASAVLILNDAATGYPFALLEAAAISAARTAASAALAARTLTRAEPANLGVIGGGVIARTVCDHLATVGMLPDAVVCHDLDKASAVSLAEHLHRRHGVDVEIGERDQALAGDLVLLATTALAPYIPADQPLRPDQVVLNISLRDLAPEILLRTNNVLDDVEHCLKAGTSPHLAEQLSGGRDFVTGTLAEVISGKAQLDPALPTVFSPFGLGVLDLAVGNRLYQWAKDEDRLLEIEDFFGETRRW